MFSLHTIKNSSDKKKQKFTIGVSLFILLVILLVYFFWYQAPYKKEVRPNYELTNIQRFKTIFSNTRRGADSFVKPLNEQFIQQNPDSSSQ